MPQYPQIALSNNANGLSSNLFVRSRRQAAFLKYVIDQTLAGNADNLKEFTIGVEVFDKDSNFDPGIDSIVRVEASRLRSKLREYYAEEGAADPVRIEIPKGRYTPAFTLTPEPVAESVTASQPYFRWGIIASLLLAVAAAVTYLQLSRQDAELVDPAAETPKVAVLPFVNMSDDEEQEYFSDGISEELLNLLSRVPGISVSSRTSSFTFKDANRNIPEISAILGASDILEGSVRRDGNTIRITAQLIDTANDRHIWSNTYDRELDDIFLIQDQISEAIVLALRDSLGIETISVVETVAPTENMDAFDLYLQAAELTTVVTVDSARRRVELLARTVAVDPTFAKAWAELSSELVFLPSFDHSLNVSAYIIRARQAAEQALLLNPRESRAHLAMAAVASKEYNWQDWYERQQPIREYSAGDRTAEVAAHVQAGQVWLGLGFLSRAIEEASAGLQLQSDNADLHLVMCMALLDLGRREEARFHLEQAILLGFTGTASDQLWEYVEPVDREAAWAATMTMYLKVYDPELLRLLPHLKRVHFAPVSDLKTERQRFWLVARELGFSKEYLLEKSPRWGYRIAPETISRLGEDELVAEQFWGNSPFTWMWSPALQLFRQSDSFKSRIRSSGMLAFWRDVGWPDLCRPLGDDDFVCD